MKNENNIVDGCWFNESMFQPIYAPCLFHEYKISWSNDNECTPLRNSIWLTWMESDWMRLGRRKRNKKNWLIFERNLMRWILEVFLRWILFNLIGNRFPGASFPQSLSPNDDDDNDDHHRHRHCYRSQAVFLINRILLFSPRRWPPFMGTICMCNDNH